MKKLASGAEKFQSHKIMTSDPVQKDNFFFTIDLMM
jgi:hypothetical protein